jgi:hypothetical protein
MKLSSRPIIGKTISAHVPAPLGGLNTIDPGGAMPETDCCYAYNVIADTMGLSSRLGWREWVTGLGGEVRTVIPFTGSHANGSTDKLYVATPAGIWDCTASSTSPTKVVTFGTTTGSAGYGVSTGFVTSAGHFLVYCDEENGLYVYPEGGAWTQVTLGGAAWAAGTVYAVGNRVTNGGKVYTCVSGGTSAGSGGPTGTTAGIADNTVTWDWVATSTTTIGPSLADQRNGLTGTPAKFVHVTVWKSRLWLTEKDSTRAWYLGINSLYGEANSFDFGSKMRAGGPLVGLFNWSYDGGSGLDTLLVGISSAGDVVIYQGTDPTSASTFGIKGCWFVGGVPAGRRVAIDYGGDILVLSLLGVMPLSKLVIGNPTLDRTQYATAKIANLFARLATERRSLNGWALHVHPTDNALLLTVPTQSGSPTEQLAMSFSTRGWSQYKDLPIYSGGVWEGNFYFGTADGRLCLNAGGVDGVLLSNANAYTPISWSVLSAFTNMGTANEKRMHQIRVTVMSLDRAPIIKASARYAFDTSAPTPLAGTRTVTTSTWDGALWDSSKWGGDKQTTQTVFGCTGTGLDVAVLVQGTATERTTLVGFDAYFDVGGLV